jgi:hypothetical protein
MQDKGWGDRNKGKDEKTEQMPNSKIKSGISKKKNMNNFGCAPGIMIK